MKKGDKNLELLLYKGKYLEVLQGGEGNNLKQVPYIIGSLSFLGKLVEAKALFALRKNKLDVDQSIMARFFLALGLVRISSYSEARHLFVKNFFELRKTKNLKSKFYAYQGPAFYRYFSGKWQSGLHFVTLSFQAAYEDDFTYGKVLAADLRGHLVAQVSNVDEGIRYLSDAAKLAKQMGNHAVSEAAEISILGYEAQYGLKAQTIVSEIEEKLRTLKVTDTYSRASLLLELSRQLTLRGRLDEVKPHLDQAAHLVYMYRNRRQEAILNLRLSYLNFVKGDNYQALSFAQSAERCLDPLVDRGLELAALGLQRQIVNSIGMKEKVIDLDKELLSKTRNHGSIMHLRMLKRTLGDTSISLQGSGDRLGILRDSLVVDDIVEQEMLEMLYDVKGWSRSQRSLVLDVLPGIHLALDRGRVHMITSLTTLGKKILLSLINGVESKEHLIQKIWAYEYNPLRHDALIYNAMNGLRRVLGPLENWVETTEGGYRLPGDLKIFSENIPLNNNREETSIGDSELNSRQIKFLKRIKSGEFAHVKQYQKIFQVSEITACRDLAMLYRKGYLIRVGRARSTRYALPGGLI